MDNLGVREGEVYYMASAGACSILPSTGLAQVAIPEVKVKHHPWDSCGVRVQDQTPWQGHGTAPGHP